MVNGEQLYRNEDGTRELYLQAVAGPYAISADADVDVDVDVEHWLCDTITGTFIASGTATYDIVVAEA